MTSACACARYNPIAWREVCCTSSVVRGVIPPMALFEMSRIHWSEFETLDTLEKWKQWAFSTEWTRVPVVQEGRLVRSDGVIYLGCGNNATHKFNHLRHIPTWTAFQLGTCNLESVNIKKTPFVLVTLFTSRSWCRRNNRPREEPAGLKLLDMDWVQEDRKILVSSPMTGQLVAQVPGKWFGESDQWLVWWS